MPFVHTKSFTPKKPNRVCTLPVTFKQYLEVLDWAGRIMQAGKRGVIGERTPSIITRLGYTAKTWGLTQTPQLSWRQKALGSKEKIQLYCEAIGQNWIWQSSSV